MTRIAFCIAGLMALTSAVACSPPAPPPPPPPAAPQMSQVERGSHLVKVGLCNDCHTPWKMGPNGPEQDMDRMLSGHPEDVKVTRPKLPADWPIATNPTFTAWTGPWGISYTANLTSDQLTGLGVWTEENFMRAMREGKHMGTSRPILPPMPWQWIGQHTDEDLKAIFAYLKTVTPITNHVPDPLIVEPPAK
jgi:mono/diheme cytochrome c family protein